MILADFFYWNDSIYNYIINSYFFRWKQARCLQKS